MTDDHATVPFPTVLLVDDEPEVLDGLRRTLRREPYQLEATTSPLEALAILASKHVDVVVSDLDMPELPGTELVARIRRDHPEVVRILLTGDASLDSALRAINEGEVHRYLTKPWDNDELRATLRDALARLDELRRTAVAGATADASRRIAAELERAHPGIHAVELDDGVYVIGALRLGAVARALATPRLRALLDPDAAPSSEGDGHATRRLKP